MDILHRFQQLVDALIRLQAAAEQYNKIFRRKAEGSPQRSIRRAGHKAGGINAVVQDVGMLAVQLAGFEVIIADKLAQGQNTAVNGVHLMAAAGLAVQVGQATPLAEHFADGAALGQGAALRHNQVRRGQLQCKGKLNLLIPRVIRGGNAKAALQKHHGVIPAHAAGLGNVQHFGVLQPLCLGGGFRVRDAGAQQIQLARPFIFTDQVGDKGFHRAALHSRNRKLRRRNQQNARFARCIRQAQRQNGQPLFSLV